MTIVMFVVAHGAATPVWLWGLAMICDTALLMAFMVLKAFGKL